MLSNEETVSKRKGKRIKKELLTVTIQTIDDLFEKFYYVKVAEGRTERTLQYKENFVTLRIFSTTRVSAET